MLNILVLAAALILIGTSADAGVVATAIATVAGSFGASTAFATAIGTFFVRSLVAVGLSLASQALRKKPRAINATGIQTTFTSTGGTKPQKFILGRYATAGHHVAPPRTFSSVGNSVNDFLTYVIEVGNIRGMTLQSVMVNNYHVGLGAEDPVLGTTLTNLTVYNPIGKAVFPHAYVRYHDGSQTAADSFLVSRYNNGVRSWTSNHIGYGIAYAVLNFRINPNLWLGGGLPDVRMVFHGIPLYDPRLDDTVGGSGSQRWDDKSTWAFSDNNIVMVYNIMRGITLENGDIWGGQTPEEDLPLADWFAAMNACDVQIGGRSTFLAGFEVDVNEHEPAEVIEELLKGCFGQIAEFGGVFKPVVNSTRAPALFITDDDIVITDPQDLDPFPGLENTHNAISGTYVEPNSLWNGAEANPIYNAAWEAEDDGRRLPLEMNFPTVFIKSQAQHLLNSYINDNRRFRNHSLVLPPSAAILEPLDTISWTSDRNGYTDKLFEVVQVQDRPHSMNQFITIRERDPSDSDWTSDDDVPDPDDLSGQEETPAVPGVGISVAARTQVIREKLTNIAKITVSASNPEFIKRVEVQYKKASETEYIALGTGEIDVTTGTRDFGAIDLEDELYDFRANSETHSGDFSDWEYLFNVDASGSLIPPSDVSGFHASVIDGSMLLDWDAVPDLDLSFYKIRHSVDNATASWANSTTVVEKVARPSNQWIVPARAGTFHIKAFDKSGLASGNYTSVVVPAGDIRTFANSLTQAEHNAFSGTKTGCSVTSNELRITDTSGAPASAIYEFSNHIDTGAIRRARVRIDADVIRLDSSSGLWDDIPGLWDDFPGLWDDWTGNAQFADTNVLFFVSTTDDDPSSSPTWSDWRLFRSADISARAFRFMSELNSTSVGGTPSIKALTAYVEYD
jgi:hypothetical protein